MMRNALYVLMMTVFLLAACGGGGDDETPAPDGATPEAQSGQPDDEVFTGDVVDEEIEIAPTFRNQLGTIIPQELVTPFVPQSPDSVGLNGFVVPPVGVLGPASTTDPNATRSTEFEYLFYEQTGGINNEILRIELYGNGRMIVNGETEINVSSSEVNAIANMMQEIDFYGMQGTFIGPPTSAQNPYRYRMGAEQVDGRSRAIQAHDGYMPPEIIRLFAMIRGLVENVPDLPVITATPVASETGEPSG